MFEWCGLAVYYESLDGMYRIVDINYYIELGYLSLEEGPGWVFQPAAMAFFDSGNLEAVCELMNELNSTIDTE